MKVRWSPEAENDLYAIGDYIALDSPAAAARRIKQLRERARRASHMTTPGRRVTELDREDIREVFLRSYRLIFRCEAKKLVMLAVLEGHRQLPTDFDPDASE